MLSYISNSIISKPFSTINTKQNLASTIIKTTTPFLYKSTSLLEQNKPSSNIKDFIIKC